MADKTSNLTGQSKDASPSAEAKNETSAEFAPRVYKALMMFQRLMRISGRIGMLLSLCVLIASIFFVGILIHALGLTTLASDPDPISRAAGGFMAILPLAFTYAGVVFAIELFIPSLLLSAAAECIQVLIDIQDNTYVEAFNSSIVDPPNNA